MRKNRKFLSAVSFLLAFVLIIGSTLGYFTDRADTSATGTAGSVRIDLIPDVMLTDADGKDILNPGDGRRVNFTIPNLGNKSVDLKETIKLTCTEPMTHTDTQAEFELYKTTDVETNANGAVVPKSGKSPITVKSVSADKKTITYNVPVVTLDGSHNLAEYEIEPEANGKDTETEEYTLVFRHDSSNAYQNKIVTVEKLVEAKQHRNTGASTWASIATQTFTFGNSDEVNVVPKRAAGGAAHTMFDLHLVGNNFTHNAPTRVEEGTNITVLLTPESGYTFNNENQINVTGNYDGNVVINLHQSTGQAEVTVQSVKGEISITATPVVAQAVETHNVTVLGNNFTHDAPATVEDGGLLSINLIPSTGFRFSNKNQVVVTGADAGTADVDVVLESATVTIPSVSGDVTIEAAPEMLAQTHNITVSGSNFTHNAPATIDDFQDVTITLTPSSGYEFNNKSQIVVTGNNRNNVSITNGVATVNLVMVIDDVTITATPVVASAPTLAYAVLDNDGKLTMFRSSGAYTDKSTGTFNDTKGREYTGKIFADIESNQMENKDDLWTDYDIATTIKSVDIADGYTITPISIFRWFNCENLTTADLTGLDTRNITDMSYMFSSCSNLTTLTLPDSFDTSNVTDMSNMFFTCGSLQSLTLPDSFNTSNVTNMCAMFHGCSNLTTLTLPDSFDTSNVIDMSSMFYKCQKLHIIYVCNSFVTTNTSDFGGAFMFKDCPNLVGGNGTRYNSSNVDSTYARIDGENGQPGYFTARP